MTQRTDAYWTRWEKLLEAAAEIQGLMPGAVLIGGSAAIHLEHRYSFDADHILLDLEEKYEEVLDFLEGRDDWETARIHPPKLILGNFKGIETGIRQLMRPRPLETELFEIKGGKVVTVPMLGEMLRTKAWMIVSRNTTRDVIDFGALADNLGIDVSVRTLADFDDYHADLIRGKKASPVIQLIRQLAEPAPGDRDRIALSRYKGLTPPFDSWDYIVAVCESVSVGLGDALSVPSGGISGELLMGSYPVLPLRFGKSLLVDTIKELFEGNRDLFVGLAAENRWDGSIRHPVLNIRFANGGVGRLEGLQTSLDRQMGDHELWLGLRPRYEQAGPWTGC